MNASKKKLENEIEKHKQEKKYPEDLETELVVLIDEFIVQLDKKFIEKYECGKAIHYTKFDLTGKIIKQYADFWHKHEKETKNSKYNSWNDNFDECCKTANLKL